VGNYRERRVRFGESKADVIEMLKRVQHDAAIFVGTIMLLIEINDFCPYTHFIVLISVLLCAAPASSVVKKKGAKNEKDPDVCG